MSGIAIRRPYPVLTQDDVDKIRAAAIEGLERIGAKVGTAQGRRILKKAGAAVDERTEIVKFPGALVEDVLHKPHVRVVLHARDPSKTADLDLHHVHLANDGTGTVVVDLETGQRRDSTSRDLADSARVSDALENHHVFWPLVTAMDFPPASRIYEDLRIAFENTPKHILYASGASGDEARRLKAMGAAVAGGEKELRKRPIMSSVQTTLAPLQLDGGMMDAGMVFGEAGIPIAIFTMPTPGATGPATLAGSVTVAAMEFLAGLTLTRLANPGCPVIWGCGISPLDMRTTVRAGGSPEHGLTGVAVTQMAHAFGVPSLVGGFDTTATMPGTQASLEKFQEGLSVILGGADLIVGLGLIEDAKTLSLEQLVIDDEMVRMIRRIGDGIVVNEDTIALDLIEKVGVGGMYLGQRHTLDHLRSEHFMPRLLERRSHDLWLADGAKGLEEKARDKVRDILAKPLEQPLDPKVIQQLKSIIAGAAPQVAAVA